MPGAELPRAVVGAHEVTGADVVHIRSIVERFPRLSRTEIGRTVCEHLGWFTAAGGHKLTACMELLERLEELGVVQLPAKAGCGPGHGGRYDQPRWTAQSDAGAELSGRLSELGEVRLEVARTGAEAQLWKEYVDRYHYLGYRRPFGCVLRYLVSCRAGVLGCVLLSGAAKAIEVRDRWIGWTARQRQRGLPWVVNNSRFLILPWVRVPHLASYVLGAVVRGVGDDWERQWGFRPLLMETFVDPERYRGTSYRAAGWTYLGRTSGRGLARAGHEYTTSPKMVFMRPLVADFRTRLCSLELRGRVWE